MTETDEEFLRLVQKGLRNRVDYTNDALYGVALLLDSYLNEDLTLEEALNEFFENTDTEIETIHLETQVRTR